MVGLEGTRLAAVSAMALIGSHEREPLAGRKRPLGITFPCPVVLPFRTDDFRVFVVIKGGVGDPRFPVAGVVQAVLRRVLPGMSNPPATHRVPRLLSISLQPLARVSPLILGIFVWHAFYLADRRSRVNRTGKQKPGRRCPDSLLRGKDSNLRPSGYEPDELPLLHPAT